jgi:hypothetical protein
MTRRRRPRIISPGMSVELADGLELDRKTIRQWRNRFAEMRCDGMLDEPRPCRPPVVGDDQIEALITTTLWLAGRGVPTGGSGATDEAGSVSKRGHVNGPASGSWL